MEFFLNIFIKLTDMPPRGRGARGRGRARADDQAEPDQLVDPSPLLQFPDSQTSRHLLSSLLRRQFASCRTFDWSVIESLGETARCEAIVGTEDATPFRRMFDAFRHPAFRELTLEFLASFRFEPFTGAPADQVYPRDHIVIRFRLGGQRHQFTLADWATTATGFYTTAEIQADEQGFYFTDEYISEPLQLQAWWPTISGAVWRPHIRESQIIDLLHRYIHRCLAGTICGRYLSSEQVPTPDLFYLRALIEHRRTQLAVCMAMHLLGVPLRAVCTIMYIYIYTYMYMYIDTYICI